MNNFQKKISWKRISGTLWSILLAVCLLTAATSCGTQGTNLRGQVENGDSSEQGDSSEHTNGSGEASGVGTEELTVQILDVGQGSAALIRQGDSFLLMDGGDKDYSSYVVSYLKKEGVERLEYVIVSHYDADHLNGVVGVLNAFECKQVLSPDYKADTKVYQSYLRVIEEKNIPVEHPRLGDTYTFADSSFRVVCPASYSYQDANSNSLGIRLSYGDSSFLICGDCTEESEQDVLYKGTDVHSDVYVANHHGSKYSNSEEFLQAVSPSYVIISCGRDNSYGHPGASVMLSIQKLGASLFRTDLQGVITAVSDGSNIRFANEVCMDYRSGEEIAEADSAGNGNVGDGNSGQDTTTTYILNTSTKKFHRPDCGSVKKMKEESRATSSESRESLISQGYEPCKNCRP
jgi:competence protein ComEC